ALVGLVGAVFQPALAAISLGLVGYKGLDRRIGRNESISHAGNVVTALSAGVFGYLISQAWIFYTVAAVSVISALTAFAIRGDEIDYEPARGGEREHVATRNHEAIRTRPRPGAHGSSKTPVMERASLVFTAPAVPWKFATAE